MKLEAGERILIGQMIRINKKNKVVVWKQKQLPIAIAVRTIEKGEIIEIPFGPNPNTRDVIRLGYV